MLMGWKRAGQLHCLHAKPPLLRTSLPGKLRLDPHAPDPAGMRFDCYCDDFATISTCLEQHTAAAAYSSLAVP